MPDASDATETEKPAFIRRLDYVQVVDTQDEWEDLIGIVDMLYDAHGNPCRAGRHVKTAEVRFPLSRGAQYAAHLIGVNFFTDYVRTCLRRSNEFQEFAVTNLERVDRDEL